MTRFVQSEDRIQGVLLPEYLDDYVAEDNPVRVIDVFVDELDLGALGFDGVIPEATGRPAYHPGALLKIYVYGYINQIASSRRLERETHRNVELMWLTGRLTPDFKTIADFRKEKGPAVRGPCRQFIALCRQLGLFAHAVAGYFKGEEVLACAPLGVTPYVPKPLTSGSNAAGRVGKPDFVYIPEDDAYRCPADQRLTWRFTSAEKGMTLHSYWTSKCTECPLKTQCTTGKERRIKRWEHEAVIDAMQDRLDRAPKSMRVRRATVEHPFGTLKAWMGATHFKTRTLEKVRTETSLHVLAYNLKRVIASLGTAPLMQAMRA